LLKFFLFYGYNSYFLIWGANHQGDWEHISVAICDGKINFVIFHHHGLKKLFYPNELEMEDGHFVVYSALGTHGNYSSRGTKIVYPKGILTIDFCNSKGYSWKCYENLQPIGDMDQELMSSGSQPLSYLKQPWQNYAGAWGAVGKFDFTTGPLGPIRKKF